MTPLRIGVVGCGNISDIYLTNLASWPETQLVSVSDLDGDRASAKAAQHGLKARSVDEMMSDSGVDLILNLTVPKAHFEVAKRGLESGKHVYNEKPLALDRKEGRVLVELALAKGLRLGGAPDTFMGAGIQTCRRLIDSGAIGTVVAGQAFMMCPGHESWHPTPEFYYEQGGGPLFDMGPYYLTALVALVGPVERVTAVARKTFATRTITSEVKKGKVIQVETPTHIAALLEFAGGAVVEMTMSFDVWHHTLPPLTLHGSEGSLLVGDPNQFRDTVHLRGKNEKDWQTPALVGNPLPNARGLGVRDIAIALDEGRPHQASAELVYHVLDVMQAVLESANKNLPCQVQSRI